MLSQEEILGEIRMGIRRKLDHMPFAKAFDVDGNEELCNATGYEVYLGEKDGDTTDPADWWNEYEDRNNELHYGR